ncbi:unnamed protein product, partial [Iphiclides podalirius]
MADEDESGRHKQLIREEFARRSEELARKQEELEGLMELGAETGFTPRASLARNPPEASLRTLPPLSAGPSSAPSSKRPLTSPEDVQDAVHRRVQLSRTAGVPPIGGILNSPTVAPKAAAPQPTAVPAATVDLSGPQPVWRPAEGQTGLAAMDKVQLLDAVHTAIKGIAAVANVTNKLNMAHKAAISGHSQDVLAVVSALELRLAETEHQVTALKLKCTSMELEAASPRVTVTASQQALPVADSYASRLKLPRGKPEMAVQPKGPAVIFYPSDESIKSSEVTKAALIKAVQPGPQGIQVQSVRKVGNSGVIVRTASASAAAKLKEAAPPTLKATDPKVRKPLVAIRNLRCDPKSEDLLEDLHRINLADDPAWPKDRLSKECQVAFKKGRLDGPRTTVVLECTSALRDKLVGLGRVYIGWDEAEVCDFVRVTCCMKCQQYGHPEKHCRASAITCAKCGETGHGKADCKSEVSCCTTCKRFRRKDSTGHTTAAMDCPARLFAEQQAINMTHYG